MKDIQLWHGDCLSLMKDIDAESVNLVIADAPYAILKDNAPVFRVHMKPIEREQEWDNLTIPQYYRLLLSFLDEAYRVSKDGATLYCFCANELAFLVQMASRKVGWYWRMVNVWHKLNPAPVWNGNRPQASVEIFCMVTKGKNNTWCVENGGLAHNHFEFPIPNGKTRKHPTQKPEGLIEALLLRSSNEGDLVLDPFMGSGVTMKACHNLGRRGIGIEIRQDYYDVAKADLEAYLL